MHRIGEPRTSSDPQAIEPTTERRPRRTGKRAQVKKAEDEGPTDVTEIKYLRKLAAGVVVYRQRDVSDELFVLKEGKVRLTRSIGPREIHIAELGPGDSFGDVELLTSITRMETATVVEDSVAIVLQVERLQEMSARQPGIAIHLMTKLAERLRAAADHIDLLMHRNPLVRVAHALLGAPRRMEKGSGRNSVLLDLDEQMLAVRLALMRSEVERALEQMEKARLIERRPEAIALHDVRKLREFVDMMELRYKET